MGIGGGSGGCSGGSGGSGGGRGGGRDWWDDMSFISDEIQPHVSSCGVLGQNVFMQRSTAFVTPQFFTFFCFLCPYFTFVGVRCFFFHVDVQCCFYN